MRNNLLGDEEGFYRDRHAVMAHMATIARESFWLLNMAGLT